MAERGCTDCQWLSEHGELHKWHSCEAKFVAPASVVRWDRESVDISRPFVNCPTWEKRALAREEQIESAARLAYDFLLKVEDSMDVRMELFRALRGDAAAPLELADLKESKFDSDKWAELVADGWWEDKAGNWNSPGGDWTATTLDAAYRLMLGQKAAEPKPAQPTEVEMRRAVMEAGWTQGPDGDWWRTFGSHQIHGWPLENAYARVMQEKTGQTAPDLNRLHSGMSPEELERIRMEISRVAATVLRGEPHA